MNETRDLLERVGERFTFPDDMFERLGRRRDRKRRNQRIAAGIVGIAVFVAAVWIVTTGGAIDRTQTPAVPGPAETGPSVAPDPDAEGLNILPPQGAPPSEPLLGELVMRDSGIHPRFAVNVYADGRLIWFRQDHGDYPNTWIEQRLGYMGLAMLVSGEVPLGGQFEDPGGQLPASAWEDAELRPYVPSRYVVFPDRRIDKLPAAAASLLSGTERALKELGERHGAFAFVVTIEDARALADILINAGFEGGVAGPVGMVRFSASGAFGDEHLFEFVPVLPDGTIETSVGG